MANEKRLIDAYAFYKKFANDTPTADGYKRVCGRHFRINCANMKGE